jgi:hypothetical protein
VAEHHIAHAGQRRLAGPYRPARVGRRHRGRPVARSVGGEVSWSQRSTLKVK